MLTYRLLITLLSPFLLGHILWQTITNKQGRYLWQRLGFDITSLPKNCLWFHCASVGEVNTLMPLLETLHTKDHRLRFIITTNTITGAKIVAQKNLDYLSHCYLPFDWAINIRRFLKTAEPAALYVVETEIWPNLFTECHNRNIAIHIINARLSAKTTQAKPWIKNLLRTSLSYVTSISTRSEKDAQLYISLGADKNIISTVGNLKFTAALNTRHTTEDVAFFSVREYVLLASTHEDEESQIYKLWKKLERSELLIIAPRHPERSAAICKRLACKNIAIRSKRQPVDDRTDVFLLDTVGELKDYFANAKLVIMGGSFVPVGGHNILEPASSNRAIITGPYMDNFKQELDLMLADKAIIQVASIEELGVKLVSLLDNAEQRQLLEKNTALLSHDVDQILRDYSDLILPS